MGYMDTLVRIQGSRKPIDADLLYLELNSFPEQHAERTTIQCNATATFHK